MVFSVRSFLFDFLNNFTMSYFASLVLFKPVKSNSKLPRKNKTRKKKNPSRNCLPDQTKESYRGLKVKDSHPNKQSEELNASPHSTACSSHADEFLEKTHQDLDVIIFNDTDFSKPNPYEWTTVVRRKKKYSSWC